MTLLSREGNVPSEQPRVRMGGICGLSQVTHPLIPVICTASQVLPSIQLLTLGLFSERALVLLNAVPAAGKGVQAGWVSRVMSVYLHSSSSRLPSHSCPSPSGVPVPTGPARAHPCAGNTSVEEQSCSQCAVGPPGRCTARVCQPGSGSVCWHLGSQTANTVTRRARSLPRSAREQPRAGSACPRHSPCSAQEEHGCR